MGVFNELLDSVEVIDQYKVVYKIHIIQIEVYKIHIKAEYL